MLIGEDSNIPEREPRHVTLILSVAERIPGLAIQLYLVTGVLLFFDLLVFETNLFLQSELVMIGLFYLYWPFIVLLLILMKSF